VALAVHGEWVSTAPFVRSRELKACGPSIVTVTEPSMTMSWPSNVVFASEMRVLVLKTAAEAGTAKYAKHAERRHRIFAAREHRERKGEDRGGRKG
jgi:hypothetical protein